MHYTVSDIALIIKARLQTDSDTYIEHLLLDSRKIFIPATSLFFALEGPRRDGHQFIPELYKKAVRHFVVSKAIDTKRYPGAIFLHVEDTLTALQQLTTFHRNRFTIPVIGITGSNGKTIVKEWLHQLLQEDYNIARSPKSYNSQVGVPLSIWSLNEQHSLGIFEAGISRPGEMEKIARIIRPSIGVLTNIGEAHSEGFESKSEKLNEKLKLFSQSEILIYPGDDELIFKSIAETGIPGYSWGKAAGNKVRVNSIERKGVETKISISNNDASFEFYIPFTDEAAIENAISCCAVLLYLGINPAQVSARMQLLQPVNMRLELKKGINHSSVINDSYSADLSSLEIALNFLDQQSGDSIKTVILSDFLQSSMPAGNLYPFIVESLKKRKISRLIGIGEKISSTLQEYESEPAFRIELYPSTEAYLKQFRASGFKDEIILVKGARVFGFEKIVQLLEQKVHQTQLEINLNAIGHNLREFQRQLSPDTKVMAMVKAFAYGSGGAEIAGILQYHHVDWLGVAYADEGVELRQAGIAIPIMVMNPEENSFEAILEYELEPELYSRQTLTAFDAFLKKENREQYPVHIEIETGMNRLGFGTADIETLASFLNSTPSFRVQSVFSHLAASEEPAQDTFTSEQFRRFVEAATKLSQLIGYPFLRHLSNSAAILRHPGLELDMVRLGIGLYGIDSSGSGKLDLLPVATLRSTVAQVKKVKAGESVSYNRKAILDRDSLIATVRIGYADGYPRRLGYGVGKMFIRDRFAPVVGTVCMDMTMIDVTDIPGVMEGDDVIIFGTSLPVQQVADWAGTIPYEIMTGISQRVKRVYFQE